MQDACAQGSETNDRSTVQAGQILGIIGTVLLVLVAMMVLMVLVYASGHQSRY